MKIEEKQFLCSFSFCNTLPNVYSPRKSLVSPFPISDQRQGPESCPSYQVSSYLSQPGTNKKPDLSVFNSPQTNSSSDIKKGNILSTFPQWSWMFNQSVNQCDSFIQGQSGNIELHRATSCKYIQSDTPVFIYKLQPKEHVQQTIKPHQTCIKPNH